MFEIFRKSVKKIEVLLKSNKNNGHSTWRHLYIYSQNEKCSRRICREDQNTHFLFNNLFPKIVPFLKWCGKIR